MSRTDPAPVPTADTADAAAGPALSPNPPSREPGGWHRAGRRVLALVPIALITAMSFSIVVMGWVMSYSNQVDVMSGRFAPSEAWKPQVWPMASDMGAFVPALGLSLGVIREGWPTVAAWLIFLACTAVMLFVNGLSGGQPAWTSDFAGGAAGHSWPSLLGMAMLFVAIHGRKRAPRFGAGVAPISAESAPTITSTPAPRQRQVSGRGGSKERVRLALAADPDLPTPALAKRLKLAPSTVRALRAQLATEAPADTQELAPIAVPANGHGHG